MNITVQSFVYLLYNIEIVIENYCSDHTGKKHIAVLIFAIKIVSAGA